MSIIDWIIILLFLGGLIAIGFAFSHKNKDIKDYFLAGRSMPTWLVVFAATGTSISAGTFVGSPELGFNTNLTFIMSCIGAVIGGVVVAALFLPKLYNSKTITIYGYIGDRFGETSKRSTSVMFILGQLFTSGSRLFIAAIAVSVIIFGSIHFHFLMYSIVILGLISTLYTMAGGIKGLLYIDAIQIMLVIGSGIVALGIVYFTLHETMSLSEIFATLRDGMVKAPAQPEYGMAADGSLTGWITGNKLQLADPRVRFDVPYNLIGALGAYAFFKVAQFSTDHEFVQRQLTCRSVTKAGVSLVWSQLLAIPIVLIFMLIGSFLYVWYMQDTQAAVTAGVFTDARDIFPQFICNSIPTGVRGLMVVGLLAAALSSFNSAINAMASSFVSDLYLPIRRSRGKAIRGDADQMAASRRMVVLMGAADGIRHAHRRHAAGQRAESRRFRHQCHVLLLCRHDGRLHHGALHQTGKHTQRRSRTYRGLPDRSVPATLHLRTGYRSAFRRTGRSGMALVVPDRCRREPAGVPLWKIKT